MGIVLEHGISRQETERMLRQIRGSFQTDARRSSFMPHVASQAILLCLFASALVRAEAANETSLASNSALEKSMADGVRLTGKERLGEKWKDEQRIDNCKVPLEKRGARPRPDACAHPPEE